MGTTRETPEMIELENMRAEHAKKLEGLSPAEQLKIYQEEAAAAHREMEKRGIRLPKAERLRPTTA